MNDGDVLIAGRHSGKKVRVIRSIAPACQLLQQQANAGAHWARVAIHGLTSLSSGRLGKDNVFVKPNLVVERGTEEFFVFLPGCKATVQRLRDDSYSITGLDIDCGYFEMNSQNSMTGLYSVSKIGRDWDAEFIESGEIRPGNDAIPRARFVAISDGIHSDANDAAGDMAQLVTKVPGVGGPFFTNYELHFTRGRGTYGGLKNYRKAIRPLEISETYGSAQMLAHTMRKAKNIKGVTWVSVLGGSVVLTQAMKILTEQGVQLPYHSAFLVQSNAANSKTLDLAHQLDLKLDRKFTHTEMFDFLGNRD
jgi:hypothetical protein